VNTLKPSCGSYLQSGFLHLSFIFSFLSILFSEPEGRPNPKISGSSGNENATLTSTVGFSSEPKLIEGGYIDFPSKLLKKGIAGTVTLNIDIDKSGKVEKCTVVDTLNSVLDSIVRASFINAKFSPAYEDGRVVESSVGFQFVFNPDSIVLNGSRVIPEIEGVVIDKETKQPIQGAIVNLQASDTSGDPDLTIPFNKYMELIGKVPGQTYKKEILSTVTDQSGHFAFRLLPSCPVNIAIIYPYYDNAHIALFPVTGSSKSLKCFLEKPVIDTALEIVVYGRPEKQSVINVEERQVATGLTHYMSNVLVSKAVIRNVPESRSAMMVRAGSPFDNRFKICGVPFLAPYHFGGSPYADVDGIMLSAMSNIDVNIDRVAGSMLDASGFILDARPGVYRRADNNLKKRPELSIDYSTLSQDFLLSLPVSKSNDNKFQIGYSRADNYSLEFLKYASFSDHDAFFGHKVPSTFYGLGIPDNFGNVTLTGELHGKQARFDSFSWFAWDIWENYHSNETTFIPWGMTSVTISPNGCLSKINFGGSRQYFAVGKQVGHNSFINSSYLSNGTMQLSADSLFRNINTHFELTTEYNQWHGSVIQKDTLGIDTNYSTENSEFEMSTHGSIEKQLGPFSCGTDLLLAGLLYGTQSDMIFDFGLFTELNLDHFQIGLNGGRITGRPDIRGLPDSLFRMEHLHTYLISMPVRLTFDPRLMFSVQPYYRKKDKEPMMNPLLYTWDKTSTTPLYAKGVDFEGEVKVCKWLSLKSSLNLSDVERRIDNKDSLYEWGIPWTVRNGAHLVFGDYSQFHIYLNYVLSHGLPYYDFITNRYDYLPEYKNLNIGIQYRSVILKNRYFTRYDAYFNLLNVLDNGNIRDYYWDNLMNTRRVYLSPFNLEFGARFGFRL
jgi:hypothetical protein